MAVTNVELLKLGLRIKASRKVLGRNQKDFSKQCGLDRSYFGGVERGERNLTFFGLCQICTGLNCVHSISASPTFEGRLSASLRLTRSKGVPDSIQSGPGASSLICPRLKSTLAVVTWMPREARRLKPPLNIAGCLALVHAIHLAKPQKTQRRKSSKATGSLYGRDLYGSHLD
jgi:transcriptional regulator with XRE-family HTH domain